MFWKGDGTEKRCRIKRVARFVPISHGSFLHISVLPALEPPLTVLQDVPPSASSPVLESMPGLFSLLSKRYLTLHCLLGPWKVIE